MEAIKELNQLADKRNREKYPRVPEHGMAKAKYSDKTANALTRAIVDWLTLNGYWATRVTSQGRYLEGQTYTNILGQKKQHPGKWIPGTTKKGTADIHAVVNGRHLSIEVKIGKDRMSDAQRRTQQDVERAGGVYLMVRTFEDFMQWYRAVLKEIEKNSGGHTPGGT